MSDGDGTHTDVWQDDFLNRRADAEFMRRFLIARTEERKARGVPDAYVLNIDAGWGEGKSYFLERFAADLSRHYVVASVNAWKDDFADDPLLAVISSIEHAVATSHAVKHKAKTLAKTLGMATGQVVAAVARGAIMQAGSRLIGDEIKTVATALGLEKASVDESGKEVGKEIAKALGVEFDELIRFRNAKSAIEKFKKSLAGFIDELELEGRGPLFVFVDELDRCRPTYSLALLERIKHLFDVGGVVFVLATDTNQLQHAIAAVYGPAFDAKRYLGRFFNQTYHFERPTRGQVVAAQMADNPLPAEKVSLPPGQIVEAYVAAACDFCGLPTRDTHQVLDLLQSIVTLWDHKVPIEFAVMLPMIIMHQQKFELTPTMDAAAEFQKIAGRHGGSIADWKLEFLGYNPQIISAVHVLERLWTLSATPLPDLGHADRESAPDTWAKGRLMREFSVLYNNSFNTLAKPYSLIRRYPLMVRTAGRLAPAI
jgi:hypothetical protein